MPVTNILLSEIILHQAGEYSDTLKADLCKEFENGEMVANGSAETNGKGTAACLNGSSESSSGNKSNGVGYQEENIYI